MVKARPQLRICSIAVRSHNPSGASTAVNLTATILALVVMVQDGPDGLAVALHLLPMPYNVFLFAALWRMPDRNRLASLIAGGWLVAMTLA